jgi:hypothetical protein
MSRWMFVLLVLVISLFFLDIYGWHKYIGFFIFLISLRGNFLVIGWGGIEWNLLLFGFTLGLFSYFSEEGNFVASLSYIIYPLLLFKAGEFVINHVKSDRQLFVILLIFSCSLAFLVLYSTGVAYFSGVNLESRLINIQFYSRNENEQALSATLIGLHLTPLMSFLPLLLLRNVKHHKIPILIGSIVTLLAIGASVIIASRTPLVIFFLILLFILYVARTRISLFSFLGLFALGSISLYGLYSIETEFGEFTSLISERFKDDDISSAGTRGSRWQEGFVNIFKYPFGGEKERIGHFHNLWLDLRYMAGVIPMIFLILVSMKSFVHYKRFIQTGNRDNISYYSLNSLYLCVFIMLFMEPILQGSFVFFMFYMLTAGMYRGLSGTRRMNHQL